MTRNYTVIRRSGTMKNGDHETSEVVIQIEDGDDAVLGRGPTEKKAVAAAEAELRRFRAEQALLNTPAVVSARKALVEAMRQAKEDV